MEQENKEKNIISMVNTPENLKCLEEIIEEHKSILKKCAKGKKLANIITKKLNNKKEIHNTFKEVKEIVDNLLDVTNIKDPKIEFAKRRSLFLPIAVSAFGIYYAASISPMVAAVVTPMLIGYNILIHERNEYIYQRTKSGSYIHKNKGILNKIFSKDRIIIPQNYFLATQGLSHEYTHHIQNHFGLDFNKHSALCEGHARGIDLKASNVLKEKTGDENYLYFSISIAYQELVFIYNSLKNKFDTTKNLSLKLFDKNNIHAKGTTLFAIAEKKYGDCIYKEFLKKDFSHLSI